MLEEIVIRKFLGIHHTYMNVLGKNNVATNVELHIKHRIACIIFIVNGRAFL